MKGQMKGWGEGWNHNTTWMCVTCSQVGERASGRLCAFSADFAANPADVLHLGGA